MAVTMQGTHHASGTWPVRCKNTASRIAQMAVMLQYTGFAVRDGRACAYSSAAKISASAVYSRGTSGKTDITPHPR